MSDAHSEGMKSSWKQKDVDADDPLNRRWVLKNASEAVGGTGEARRPDNRHDYDDPVNYAVLSLTNMLMLWNGETKSLAEWAANRIATYRRMVVDYAAAFQMTPGTAEDKRQRAIEATGGLTLAIVQELDIVKEILHGSNQGPAESERRTSPPLQASQQTQGR